MAGASVRVAMHHWARTSLSSPFSKIPKAATALLSAWSARIATARTSWDPPIKDGAGHMVTEHTPIPQLKLL